ncbi:hypothetical protein H0H92_001953 [Tricholoma furcatifolium]|nr:hypothetical protein H0H92_001953 [Tricholoma furcatifolium]
MAMRLFALFSSRSVDVSTHETKVLDIAHNEPALTKIPTIVVSQPSQSIIKTPSDPVSHKDDTQQRPRRLSLPALSFSRPREEHKPVLSSVQEHQKKSNATAALLRRAVKPRAFSADKRAKDSALILRSLIVGPTASPQLTSLYARPQLSKLKSQLMEPKSANKVIAQLRVLPALDAHPQSQNSRTPPSPSLGLIHAVCLQHTDADIEKLHFSPLASTTPGLMHHASIYGAAPIEEVTKMLSNMNVVSLFTAPGLGIGQPGDGEGILAGAVPTAETVINGFEQITPQLMALGYATGKSIMVDHKAGIGIHPPTDRMSVLTYWWGLELLLPPPSLDNLAQAKSVAGTVVNFLTALALVNNGVKEILPFVRYISQYIDFEFNTIKSQDQGQGVVCAATWIMPAALVPRPWDFPPPPPPSKLTPPPSTPPAQPAQPPSTGPSASSPTQPTPSAALPSEEPSPTPVEPQAPEPLPPVAVAAPLTLPGVADSIVGAYADSVTFQPVADPVPTEAKALD